MKLETIKKDKKKNIIIGSMIVLGVIGCITLTTTRAKYRNVQSLKLASGTVNYKAADLNIVAVKTSEDGTNYTDQTEIPKSGYTLNTSLSKCRIPDSSLNGENAPADESISIEYKDGRVYIGINKKNTKCYLYFDKILGKTSSTIISDIEKSSSFKSSTPDFSTIAIGAETEVNNGIYKVADGMYGGNAYYWRGAATTNHVIFDGKCWRIVRINGDGSIRLIYNGIVQSGDTCTGNGENADSVVLSGTKYNASYDNSSYVGWTYSVGKQRPSEDEVPQMSGTDAPLKKALQDWYSSNANISAVAKAKVDTAGKFCNDRNTQNNEQWRATGEKQYYAGYVRIYETFQPTLSCPAGDVYNLEVGMITADEVMLAGGKGENNTSYYLNVGVNYWTMSPLFFDGLYAQMFRVDSNGHLSNINVNRASYGVRPVINLKADSTFNVGSDGTQNNPYIVQ